MQKMKAVQQYATEDSFNAETYNNNKEDLEKQRAQLKKYIMN